MKWKNISQDKKTSYTLKENEQCIFFLFNRSGKITFELIGTGAEAHIFCFFIGKNADKYSLNILQNHRAPKTVSRTLIKSVVSDTSTCTYDGTIFIDTHALSSDAMQESRALLLSSEALVAMKPTLEILADDVKCSHKATASPLDTEALFFAESRGISLPRAENLLISGFFSDAITQIETLGVEKNILAEIQTLLKTFK